MLFASDLCFICRYFQSRCNFVQLLQVFIINNNDDDLMRLFQSVNFHVTTMVTVWWVSVKFTAALFWATVSFCCQSLIAKEHIKFSSRTGEHFNFSFICCFTFSSPLFCFTLWVELNNKTKKKRRYHVKLLLFPHHA